MKKILFVFIVIFLFLPVSSANNLSFEKDLTINNNSEPNFYPDDIYEWSDGFFSGNVNNNQGAINGYIQQGRNNDVGQVIGDWSMDDQNGFFKGFVRGSFIFGSMYGSDMDFLSLFFGKISVHSSDFSGHITSLKFGRLTFSGMYDASFMPELTGEYGVGVKDYHLIDENRPELYTEDEDDFREMMIRIWYPTDFYYYQNGVDYMDSVTFDWLMGRSPIPLITVPKNAYEFVCPHGVRDADIVDGNFPVLIFSPGYDGTYEIYTSFIEDMVSNGFIVVSINHPYVSGVTVFPDGRVARVKGIKDFSFESVVGDAEYVLDYLFEMYSNDVFFRNKFDLTRIGMYGHSFGGGATTYCCYNDDRISAGLTYDGVIYEELMSGTLDTPYMMMLAETSFTSFFSDDLWDNLSSDGFRLVINGSTHYAYSDVGILLNHLLPLIPPNLLGFGRIEPRRMVNATKSFTLAFFQVFLKDYPIDTLLDLNDVFPEVLIHTKK